MRPQWYNPSEIVYITTPLMMHLTAYRSAAVVQVSLQNTQKAFITNSREITAYVHGRVCVLLPLICFLSVYVTL